MGFSSGTSTRWLFVHCFQIELEFGVLVFVEGGKPENPEKNPRSRNENQQQTQPTCRSTVNFRLFDNPLLKCYYDDEKMLFLFSADSDFIFGKNAPCQLLRLNFQK